jgi:phosphoribosylglycinamide formyltransferase-1
MRFVILGSGTGSNAEAILREWEEGRLGGAEPVAIFSDKPDARILQLGKRFGVPSCYHDPGNYRTRLSEQSEDMLVEAIRKTGAEWVVLAGFMRVIKAPLMEAFPDRIINLHPSLLPSFKGLHAIRQAFDYGVRYTGCSVHIVTGELDGGPILDQAVVRIEDTDTLETLEAKVHAAEHQLLPQVIARLAQDHGHD